MAQDLAQDANATSRPDARRGRESVEQPRTWAGWAILATAGLGGFAVLSWLVASRTPIYFDQPLLEAARNLGAYMALWQGLSDAANLPLIAIGVGIVVALFLAHRRREAVLVVLVLAAVTAGSEGVKELVARPRPPGFDTSIPGVVYSYPSGHVLEALTIYGIIAILAWRSSLPTPVRVALPILFAVIVILVAVARVAVNAHYPSDVLAGFLGGLGCLGLFGLLSQAVNVFGCLLGNRYDTSEVVSVKVLRVLEAAIPVLIRSRERDRVEGPPVALAGENRRTDIVGAKLLDRAFGLRLRFGSRYIHVLFRTHREVGKKEVKILAPARDAR